MTPLAQAAWDAAATVVDPEIPVLTIEDLGVLRRVTEADDGVTVEITPTYSGCPAMNMITLEVELALARAGVPGQVRLVMEPAWTTDWLSPAAREKLRAYGIAPPEGMASRRALFGDDVVSCPRCASRDTERIAEFGSTSCKSLRRCLACREPFDHFRCH